LVHLSKNKMDVKFDRGRVTRLNCLSIDELKKNNLTNPIEIGKSGYRTSEKFLLQDDINTIAIDWKNEWRRILVVSDLHLGNGKRHDCFKHNSREFMNWIKSYHPNVVILNGDIFELWQHDLQTVLEVYSDLMDDMAKESPVFFFLRGNHDCLSKVPDHLELNIPMANKTILVSHGFQNDPTIVSKFNQAFTWYIGRIKERYAIFDYILDSIVSLWSSESIRKYANLFAESAVDQYNYDVVIYGHTHDLPHIRNYGKSLIVNDGFCQKGSKKGVLITNDGNITVID